mmetsp:Transcript_28/g.41  ORF Transcript_28/g.41 Transcript_28/m.41 type:complete len:102 (+) Transcript_28:895-1200(+)
MTRHLRLAYDGCTPLLQITHLVSGYSPIMKKASLRQNSSVLCVTIVPIAALLKRYVNLMVSVEAARMAPQERCVKYHLNLRAIRQFSMEIERYSPALVQSR